MTDDERERLIAGLRQVEYHAPWAWTGLRKVQAQLQADGERIKALEAALRRMVEEGSGPGTLWAAADHARELLGMPLPRETGND